MAKEGLFKTASFGGYDKTEVDMYIEEIKAEHAKALEEMNKKVLGMQDTVRNLQVMRENNSNESKQNIESLKKYNESLAAEIEGLKKRNEEMAAEVAKTKAEVEAAKSEAEVLKQKEASISSILIDTKIRADAMMKETESKCQALATKTEEERKATLAKTEAERKAIMTKAEEDRAKTKQFTEDECRKKLEKAEQEKNAIITQAKYEATTVRSQLRKECTGISTNMNDLMEALQGVVKACNNTKIVSDKALQGVYDTAAKPAQQPQQTQQPR